MIEKALSAKILKEIKITDFPITDISYNYNTSIMCAATYDGRLLLSALDVGDQNYSQILTPLESISKVKWLNSYEFIIVGNERFLHHFSIMNLKNVSFEIHNSSITSLEKHNDIIYTGSTDGKIIVWDINQKAISEEMIHKVRGKEQPIKDFKVKDNYLYSSTIYKGRMWVWDLRQASRPVYQTETENCQNSLVLCRDNVFSINDQGILKTSLNLQFVEYFHKEPKVSLFPPAKIVYSEYFDSFLWNRKDSLNIKSEHQLLSIKVPDMGGFEPIDTNRVLVYTNTGLIFVNEIFENFKWAEPN